MSLPLISVEVWPFGYAFSARGLLIPLRPNTAPAYRAEARLVPEYYSPVQDAIKCTLNAGFHPTYLQRICHSKDHVLSMYYKYRTLFIFPKIKGSAQDWV